MSRKHLMAIMAAAIMLVPSAQLWAHKTNTVHPDLTGDAVDLLPADHYEEPRDNTNTIEAGSSAEDNPIWRAWNHFFPALDGSHTALAWCKETGTSNTEGWPSAIDEYDYTDAAKTVAYGYLGQCLHLVEDMSVPAHVNRDEHWPDDDFETYCKDHLAQLSNGSAASSRDNLDEFFTGGNTGAKDLTVTASRFAAVLARDEESQPASTFKSMFPSLAYVPGY